jgi:signal transduction histidine kinase
VLAEAIPTPDLCAYRVAQDSLTNALKHAGPANAGGFAVVVRLPMSEA